MLLYMLMIRVASLRQLLYIFMHPLILQAEKEADDAVRVVQAVDTEEGISALQGALSDAEHKRQDLHGKYIQQKQSRERAERECIELKVANEELGIKLSDVELEVDGLRRQASSWKEIMQGQGGSVATLKDKMEKLVRENHEFKEENEIRRQEVSSFILLLSTYHNVLLVKYL